MKVDEHLSDAERKLLDLKPGESASEVFDDSEMQKIRAARDLILRLLEKFTDSPLTAYAVLVDLQDYFHTRYGLKGGEIKKIPKDRMGEA